MPKWDGQIVETIVRRSCGPWSFGVSCHNGTMFLISSPTCHCFPSKLPSNLVDDILFFLLSTNVVGWWSQIDPGVAIYLLSFLIQIEVFLVLFWMGDFWLYPGHFVYCVIRLKMLLKVSKMADKEAPGSSFPWKYQVKNNRLTKICFQEFNTLSS